MPWSARSRTRPDDDLELAVSRARFAQQRWAARPARERAAVLLRFHDLVLDRRAEAMDLIQLEGGKARRDALEEIHETANAARYYGRASPGTCGRASGAVRCRC